MKKFGLSILPALLGRETLTRSNVVAVAAAILAVCSVPSSDAKAATVFFDSFDNYAYQLNWAPPSNWTVPGPGAVDLIGQTTTITGFDFYPGNGGYVDLDGSNGLAGTLQTVMSFLPGTYTLSFNLGGNSRGDIAKTTVISLGSFSQSITLASGDPLQNYILSVTTNGGNLSFTDLPGGNGNIGNILDNVILMTAAVPEPSTWAMMLIGFTGIGFMAYRRKSKPTLMAA